MKKGKIAFFLANYALGTNISVINAIKCLKKEGYLVDLFLYNVFDYKHVKIPDSKFYVYKRTIISIFIEYLTSIFSDYYFSWSVRNFFNKKFIKENYDLIFSIDSRGLILAKESTRNTEIIHYSLELYYEGHPDLPEGFILGFKKYERYYIKYVKFIIIQDQDRAKFLLKDLHLNNSDFVYVPVGTMGETIKMKSFYLHDKFKIPRNMKIILQIGSIHPTRKSLDIAKIAKDLDEKYFLVFHGMIGLNLIDKINKYNVQKNIFISNKLEDIDTVENIIASAYVGLVFYTDRDINNYLIGHASGQLTQFLKCGIPVITVDFPSIKNIIQKYNCGIVVNDVDKIPDALKIIEENYDNFRKNAFNCYEQIYNYEKNFKKVLIKLNEIL